MSPTNTHCERFFKSPITITAGSSSPSQCKDSNPSEEKQLHLPQTSSLSHLPDLLSKMSTVGELGCIYACLALHDDGIAITSDKIATLVKASNVEVEAYWPGLFAKLVEKRNIEDLITNIGSGGGGGAVAIAATGGAAPAAAAAAPVEEKKEEPMEESDDDMGFSLFD